VPLLRLSDEQQALVDHAEGHLFAEACPGAGKTRVIVARYLRRTREEPRKGIALVSFTNAAIDEVRSRCGDRPDALKAPHFVGTFDSFINRFISRPLYVRYYDKTPRFIESWQDTKHGRFRFDDMKGLPDFQLDWFLFEFVDGQLCATLRDDWIDPRSEPFLRQYVTANRSRLEKRADIRCRALVVRNGLMSCAASRAMATGLLQRPALAQRFGQLLANRFSEIVVDEAQDCGPEELLILDLLKQFGVAVVAVADLDQSIFAFRRVDPDKVRAFTKELGAPFTLNGNFRSSPAICALNNSLRFGSRDETACGENASCPLPVFLLEYKNQDEVAPAVDTVLTLHKRPRNEVIFLAYKEKEARRCAGVRSDRDSLTTNAVLGVAWAHTILRSRGSTPADRLRAVRTVEKTLRVAANVDDEDVLALDERWLRDLAYRLAASLDPAGSTAKEYAAKVRDFLNQTQWPNGVSLKGNLGTFLKAPLNSAWPTPNDEASAAFPFATIHSVKGREFPTVVLVLPKDLRTDSADQDVLNHWERDTASEPRRVLYVGASRSQTLLILAVHNIHTNRVAGQLKRDGVPYYLTS
jgi:DNA helicase II / ATP-dependent DNA helicase PcrA